VVAIVAILIVQTSAILILICVVSLPIDIYNSE
jgi:hypothetical protein